MRALKDRDVPVAGVDRMVLTDQLAVMDLVALGAFLLLPEDDLTLATVLKGPLLGFDEALLFTLAHGRAGTLWASLGTHARDDARIARGARMAGGAAGAGRISCAPTSCSPMSWRGAGGAGCWPVWGPTPGMRSTSSWPSRSPMRRGRRRRFKASCTGFPPARPRSSASWSWPVARSG